MITQKTPLAGGDMTNHAVGVSHRTRSDAAMQPAERLLSRLEGVRQTGPGRWIAHCPAHDDRRPSLSIRELSDGRVLLHDFGGCDVHSIVSSLGLELSDLFPPRAPLEHVRKPERRPFPAEDVLRCLEFETLIVSAAANALAAGESLSDTDRERLAVAVSRIQSAAALGGAS